MESMLTVKANHKKTYEPNLLCRFCHKTPETQEHILQDCLKIKRKNGKVEYNKLFEDDVATLKGIAESIITIEEIIRNPNLNSMSSSDQSEPPGWPGHMQYYYNYYYMESIWGRQDPGGPHVGPMNFAIWVVFISVLI